MGDDLDETPNNWEKRRTHVDLLIAALADRQHGVVSTQQLHALGPDARAIHYRARVGRLFRIHRGVYAVGRRKLTREGHWMAAVLAYGPDAVLSHRSAAALWGIGHGAAKIHVTAARATRSRKAITAHIADLHAEDRDIRHGIPVTSVARTMLDLAAREHDDIRLTKTIETADRLGRFDLRALERAIARQPRRAGAKRLRAVLADYRDPEDTRSDLERDFLALIANARLPRPQVNVIVAGILVDAYWPSWRLTVELDSPAFHTSPRQFERDRVRDAELQKAGLRVLRVTRKRLDNASARVLEDIRALRRPRA